MKALSIYIPAFLWEVSIEPTVKASVHLVPTVENPLVGRAAKHSFREHDHAQ